MVLVLSVFYWRGVRDGPCSILGEEISFGRCLYKCTINVFILCWRFYGPFDGPITPSLKGIDMSFKIKNLSNVIVTGSLETTARSHGETSARDVLSVRQNLCNSSISPSHIATCDQHIFEAPPL